jgi:hypothetical protein
MDAGTLMSVSINEATGEVTAVMQGQTFRFHGTNRRLGDLERVLGVTGLPGIYEKLSLQSAPINTLILTTLCCSGHKAEDFDDLVYGLVRETAMRAILATLMGALPPIEEDEGKRGNGRAARVTAASPGGATGKSPLAS